MHLREIAKLYCNRNDVSENTASDYLLIAAQFDHCTGSISVDDLRGDHVNDYLDWLKHPHTYGGRIRTCCATTIAGRRTKVLVLWRWAYSSGLTNNRPDDLRIKKIRIPEPDPQGWTHEEVQHLVAWCEANLPRRLRLVPIVAGNYLAAMFLFLWDTGMRISDVKQVTFDQVETGYIKWRQGKTGRWHRAKLKPRTLTAIAKIKSPDRRLVWPRPSSTRTPLYRMIKRAVKGAGLLGSAKWMRSGGATDCEINEKGSAPDYLGHAPGSRVAYRHYVKREAQIRMASPSEI